MNQHTLLKQLAAQIKGFFKFKGFIIKNSHAHEVVASFYGYKSRAALLSDSTFDPKCKPLMYKSWIDDRLSKLEDFPKDGPCEEEIYKELVKFLKEYGYE